MEPDLSESQICVNLVKDFINKYLDINASHMIFDRVQRLGNSKKAKLPRPIIAKFHYFKEREIVRNASNKKKKKQLKVIKRRVSAQILKEWGEVRHKLSTV